MMGLLDGELYAYDGPVMKVLALDGSGLVRWL